MYMTQLQENWALSSGGTLVHGGSGEKFSGIEKYKFFTGKTCKEVHTQQQKKKEGEK